MRFLARSLWLPLLVTLSAPVTSSAALEKSSSPVIKPGTVRTADGRKTDAYLRDGLIVGGDRGIEDVAIKDIRRASNSGFERVVIDLESARAGEKTALQRPPYYQVAVTSDEQRVVFTLWGMPRIDFDPKKVISAFKKGSSISAIELLPRLNDDSWTFVLGLKPNQSVEVFELSQPARIILDVHTDARRAK